MNPLERSLVASKWCADRLLVPFRSPGNRSDHRWQIGCRRICVSINNACLREKPITLGRQHQMEQNRSCWKDKPQSFMMILRWALDVFESLGVCFLIQLLPQFESAIWQVICFIETVITLSKQLGIGWGRSLLKDKPRGFQLILRSPRDAF